MSAPETSTLARLDPQQTTDVLALVAAASQADGTGPLSEHVLLHLRHGGDADSRHVLLTAGTSRALLGYAHLDATDTVLGPVAELVVHPAARGQGLGRRLAVDVTAAAGPRLRLWAHGHHPGAAALAAELGLRVSRELWQLRRSLLSAVPSAQLPPGISVRSFRTGADDEAWVALNARAFASHPEQGTWTVEDLHRRQAEAWFDESGFLLAEREGPGPGTPELLGFHWTKVHGGGTGHGHEPIGEVYVLGVDPTARGLGLGRALTVLGLEYLRGLGLTEVMLYVEATSPASRLYASLGFRLWEADVMYVATSGVRG